MPTAKTRRKKTPADKSRDGLGIWLTLGLVFAGGVVVFAGTPSGGGSGNVNIPNGGGGGSAPRGIRNNNPGNIKISSSAWQGKVPVSQNTDGTFEQFTSYAYGVRAMLKLLQNYIQRDGKDTIRKIIYKYAPPGGTDKNPTENYIRKVSEWSGIGADQRITFTRSTVKPLSQAMAYFENGRPAISDTQFEQGWNLLNNTSA